MFTVIYDEKGERFCMIFILFSIFSDISIMKKNTAFLIKKFYLKKNQCLF